MTRLMFKVTGAIHTALYRLSGGRLGGRMKQAPVLLSLADRDKEEALPMIRALHRASGSDAA